MEENQNQIKVNKLAKISFIIGIFYVIDIFYLMARLWLPEFLINLSLLIKPLAFYDTLVSGLDAVVLTLAILALVQINKTKEAGKKFAVSAIVMVGAVWLVAASQVLMVLYYQGF